MAESNRFRDVSSRRATNVKRRCLTDLVIKLVMLDVETNVMSRFHGVDDTNIGSGDVDVTDAAESSRRPSTSAVLSAKWFHNSCNSTTRACESRTSDESIRCHFVLFDSKIVFNEKLKTRSNVNEFKQRPFDCKSLKPY